MRFLKLFCLLVVLFPANAFALDLDMLKSQGKVGETQKGYVASVGAQGAEVDSYVSMVNGKRKAAYNEVAGHTGQSLAVVEKLAADKIFSSLSSGQYYQNASGKWVRK